jgi:hypothetical protein
VAAAILNWGMVWTGLQQSLGVPTAADICAQTQPTLIGNAGIVRDGLGLRLRHYCLSLATPTIESLSLSVAAKSEDSAL